MATKEIQETKSKLETPKDYGVFLLNDDYTSMEFVVHILMNIFHKNVLEAEELMLAIHKKGKALCGVYTKEVAETKVAVVHQLAKEHEFPLRAIIEEI